MRIFRATAARAMRPLPVLRRTWLPQRRRWLGWVRHAASMQAQRRTRDPCLVIRPLFDVVSDSRNLGVSPAHEHR